MAGSALGVFEDFVWSTGSSYMTKEAPLEPWERSNKAIYEAKTGRRATWFERRGPKAPPEPPLVEAPRKGYEVKCRITDIPSATAKGDAAREARLRNLERAAARDEVMSRPRQEGAPTWAILAGLAAFGGLLGGFCYLYWALYLAPG